MSDSILQRYAAGRMPAPPRGGPVAPAGEETDDHGCFSWLRGMRERSPMLEFRRKDGRSVAYDYALLRKVIFDPSEGITLHFDEERVRIVGRNLDLELTPGIQLLRGIQNRRVPWVCELGEVDLLGLAEATTVIERFEFEGAE